MREIKLLNRVYVKSCADYKKENIDPVINELIEHMCADNLFEDGFAGKNVVIKPNLLARRTPDACVTTDPSIVKAAARFFIDRGATVTIADSPGGAYTVALLGSLYKTTMMDRAAEESGSVLNRDLSYETVSYKEGKKSKNFNIIKPINNAYLVVNLCRLKTHALCEMSAAVKNMFGTIPGLQKAEQHARFPGRADFANMLIDLCLVTAPQINIVDAVIAMEGNGPAGGKLKRVGTILGSSNPFALDLVCASIMGFKASEVGTVKAAIERGLCPEDISLLAIEGENPADFTSDFIRPDGFAGGILKQLPDIFGGRLQKILEPRPIVINKRCKGCGECVRCCPEKTIVIKNNKAAIFKEACIKCYCCQELCPKKAIKVKRNIFLKIPDMFCNTKNK